MKIDRTDPVIPFNLGNVLDAAGRRGEAIYAYEQAIARDATFAEAWLNLGAVREGMNQLAEAVACYREAVQARPDYPEALHTHGKQPRLRAICVLVAANAVADRGRCASSYRQGSRILPPAQMCRR
jgi:tetratricopeptide (TPR) repeat protein